MGRRAVAGHERAALDLGAWLCWADEAGQNLKTAQGDHLGAARQYSGGDGDRQRVRPGGGGRAGVRQAG
ncbi:hypothetical protein [Streptosporangium sp. NPDC006007]|uniref:hypothetical protein n=1 Tax=Streptosporangium sp. NPDC006007 TaxID=3154575 RepID=UPI0033B04FA4